MTFFIDLMQVIGIGLVTLLPLANPLTTVVLFLSLSGKMTHAFRRQQAKMTCVYVFVIMTAAFYSGHLLMHVFGISIPGMRIAGGVIVGLIGLNLLFAPTAREDSVEVSQKTEELRNKESKDIALVPLAMPSTAGPGTLAMIISNASWIGADADISVAVIAVAPVLTFLIIAAILWFCLSSAERIVQYIGQSGIQAISRIMGFLLACMGIQFIINGILEIVANYPNV